MVRVRVRVRARARARARARSLVRTSSLARSEESWPEFWNETRAPPIRVRVRVMVRVMVRVRVMGRGRGSTTNMTCLNGLFKR